MALPQKGGEKKCRVSHRGDFSTIAECLKMKIRYKINPFSPLILRTTIFIHLHKARFRKIGIFINAISTMFDLSP